MWIKTGTGWKKGWCRLLKERYKYLQVAWKETNEDMYSERWTHKCSWITSSSSLVLLLMPLFGSPAGERQEVVQRHRLMMLQFIRQQFKGGDRCSSYLLQMSVHLVPSRSPPISELRIIICTAELWFMLLCCRLRFRSQGKTFLLRLLNFFI